MFSVKSKRIFIHCWVLGFVAGWLLLMFGDSIQFISTGVEGYVDLVADQQCGFFGALIVNRPAIQLLLRSIYLFFSNSLLEWFQIESAYYLFKSFNAIFYIFFAPVGAFD